MNDQDLFKNISITKDGTICLGQSVICDGFESGYHASVFTHIHSDHLSDKFATCMHRYNVYCSKITSDLLESMTEESHARKTQYNRIDFDSPQLIRFGDKVDVLTLLESKHMLGASQVFLNTHDKIKILYSGDIAPNDNPPDCDILVLDSTHGDPRFDKKIDGESLTRRLVDTVLDSISRAKPVCIHAHRGRLQFLMHILSTSTDIPNSIPFLTGNTDRQIAKVYDKYGLTIKDMTILNTFEGDEITFGDYPWIEFRTHAKQIKNSQDKKMTRISMMGGFGKNVMSTHDDITWFASDEHAEFSDLLKYVEKSNPKVVVTDNVRTKFGITLAKHIEEKLKIPAKSLPELKK